MREEELLTIGRFARLCRLSVKQLRHYDDVGLLRPVRVDRATGYRYYATDQARDALTVALLREIDVPLAVIAETLAARGADRTLVLRAERDRLAERIARDRERLHLLDRLAADRAGDHEVTTIHEPEVRLAVVRAQCGPTDVGAVTGACVGRLLGALAGTRWTPPIRGLFPLDLVEGMRIAVGVPTGTGHNPSGTEPWVLPEGPALATVHIGPYAQLPLAYHALLGRMHADGLRPAGPAREEYLVTPHEADPEDLTTRVLIPIETEEAAA
ncbi:MerR family transcriptional regulator [Embleya scabrispora]|uniref:MerR family transcriptional regulator n=1 Tax=Embleya scabrispora TaxID=159449 RepID=UPI0003771DBD|nr:MerR family transcriptional regulator [Embleya scabrispora]MYS81724.1 MerR family transcriptional regulator [Streptomyces sp. SID5474]